MLLKIVTIVTQSVLTFFKGDPVKTVKIGQLLKLKYEANSEK